MSGWRVLVLLLIAAAIVTAIIALATAPPSTVH